MANQINFTPEQINQMLQMASQKLGTDPNSLRTLIEKGDVSGVANSMGGPMGKKIGEVLSNPTQVQKMMNSPDMQKILDNLGKK